MYKKAVNVNDGNITCSLLYSVKREGTNSYTSWRTVHVDARQFLFGQLICPSLQQATAASTRSDPNHSRWFLRKTEDHARRGHILVSGATHQTCPCVVADLSYRTTSRRHFGLNQREIVLVSAAQSTRIRYVNFVRTSPILDHPYATGLTDPQYRHQTLSHYVRSATNQ